MTRQLLFTYIFSAVCLTAWAQHDIGIKANFGLSYISTKYRFSEPDNTTQKIYFSPSGQGGLFYNAHLGARSVVGTEFLLIQIEGKDRWTTPYDYFGSRDPIIETTWRHITYLGIPLYYGYKMKRFTVYMGAQVSFLLTKSVDVKMENPPPGDNGLPWNRLPIHNYDFGLRTGITYKLSHKFALETTYYYGLVNIYKSEGNNSNPPWNIQQLVLGVRYNFSRKKE